jgi:hypothetical protein
MDIGDQRCFDKQGSNIYKILSFLFLFSLSSIKKYKYTMRIYIIYFILLLSVVLAVDANGQYIKRAEETGKLNNLLY